MWNIEYYESASGKRPVEKFIDSLDAKSQARIRTLDLLEEFGINLGMSYARHLEKQLWELRVRQSRNRYLTHRSDLRSASRICQKDRAGAWSRYGNGGKETR